MKSRFEIRPATYDDLPEIADVHVRTWQQTYLGQMPQDFLDALDPVARLKAWQEGFARHQDNTEFGTFVARTPEALAGFISYGPSRDDDRTDWLEIFAINILKEHWSKGIGYALFSSVRDHFKHRNVQRTCLWVLDTNANALQAYARWGGLIERTRTKQRAFGSRKLKEVSVRFDFG